MTTLRLLSLSLALLLCLATRGIQGYSSGAPTMACTHMTPSHYPATANTVDPAPYVISFANLDGSTVEAYEAGKEYLITITCIDSAYFKGFVLTARKHNFYRNDNMGTFKPNSATGYDRILYTICQDKAITHKSGFPKTRVEIIWTAPSEPAGDIYFRATVARSYSRFWLNLRSSVFKDASLMPTTTTTTTITPTPGLTDILAPGVRATNVSDICQETSLDPLSTQRPNVAILCAEDSHCPCGWRCCPQCQNEAVCAGHAICRLPRDDAETTQQTDLDDDDDSFP